MELLRYLLAILLVLGCLLIGCSEPAATPEPVATDTPVPEVAPQTETATGVPQTPAPTDTATPVPPAPTEESASEPSPTETPVPHGTFKGCLYYRGKKLAGGIYFKNSDYENIPDPLSHASSSGCLTRTLPAGSYYVFAQTIHFPDCRPEPPAMENRCSSDEIIIEILPGKVTEVDFQLEAPDRGD